MYMGRWPGFCLKTHSLCVSNYPNVSGVTSKGIPWQVSVARSYKLNMET